MNRRNLLKVLAAAPALPLAKNLVVSDDELYPFQRKALAATEKYRRTLFIWPRMSGKTFLCRRLQKEAGNFPWDERWNGCPLIDSSHPYENKEKKIFIGGDHFFTNRYQYGRNNPPPPFFIEKYFEEDYKIVVWATPDKYNNDWLIDNIERFDYVDWRNSSSLPNIKEESGRYHREVKDPKIEHLCALFDKKSDRIFFPNPRVIIN
jgi:hypothetical protein